MAVSDDEIIRRKLLIDGDGGTDDRRITTCLKVFLKWSLGNESPEESNASSQKILHALAQVELALEKSHLIHNMNLKEQKSYEELNQQIEVKLKTAYEKISECKSELQQAKRIRRNRQEYDALAKVIQQHPDRQETLKQLEALDRELESLKVEKETLEQKLDLRRKQFHTLIAAIHELQWIIDEDERTTKEDQQTMETS